MKESVVTEHLNLNTVQKLIIFNNSMLLNVSGKRSSFEVKAAHRNQKAQILATRVPTVNQLNS